MKTKTLFLFLLSLILITSCSSSENHLHDGEYSANTPFVGNVLWKVNGDEITVENSLLGVTKVKCKQYHDRIDYVDSKGVNKIAYILENGDLKLSDLIVLKKEQSSNINNQSSGKLTKASVNNHLQNFDLSNDSYSDESAVIKEIKIVENEVYIVVDVIRVEYNENMDFKIINENSNLRTYKVVQNILIKDNQCSESKTLEYIINNNNRIKTISPFGFVLITTNNNGELTKLNLGCWN